MSKYFVELNAFQVGVRIVDVPQYEIHQIDRRLPVEVVNEAILELIFKYGQNDVDPQKCPSVSVGDVIIMPSGARWKVKGCGFERDKSLHERLIEKRNARALAYQEAQQKAADQAYRDALLVTQRAAEKENA